MTSGLKVTTMALPSPRGDVWMSFVVYTALRLACMRRTLKVIKPPAKPAMNSTPSVMPTYAPTVNSNEAAVEAEVRLGDGDGVDDIE